MAKKYLDRWREYGPDGPCHRQATFDSRTERDAFRARRTLGDVPTKGSARTFDELATQWLEEHSRLEKAPGQYEQDLGTYSRYLKPAFGDIKLKSLDESHLKTLKLALQRGHSKSGKQLRPKTINDILSLAKTIAKFGTKTGKPRLLASNPFDGVKLVEMTEQPFDYWTPTERDFFIRRCKQVDPEFACLVTVACHTGLRRGELAGLRRYQLDFDKRLIQVSASYNFLTEARVNRTKNGKVAFVPMNPAVYEALKDRKLMAPDRQVFEFRLEKAAAKLRYYAEKFKCRPIRLHDLRHTFASSLVANGVPLYDVQRLMRHETPEMTQHYAHLAPQHLQSAVDGLCAPSVRPASEKEAKSLEDQENVSCRLSDSNRAG